DLLRFFRLYRYRHRLGAASGIAAAGEFQLTLSRSQPRRFLATLAHHSVRLAARLSVRLVRQAAKASLQSLSQRSADNADRRPLARRRLDLRSVGRVAWVRSDFESPLGSTPSQAETKGAAGMVD